MCRVSESAAFSCASYLDSLLCLAIHAPSCLQEGGQAEEVSSSHWVLLEKSHTSTSLAEENGNYEQTGPKTIHTKRRK